MLDDSPLDTIKLHYDRPDSILIESFTPTIWHAPTPKIQAEIDKTWLAKADESTNGLLLRLDNATLTGATNGVGGVLSLDTSVVPYIDHVATRTEPDGFRADPIYVSALLEAGKYLVFGSRKNVDRDRGVGEFNVAAGGVRVRKDFVAGIPSLEAAVRYQVENGFSLPENYGQLQGAAVIPLMVFGTQLEPTGSFLHRVTLGVDERELNDVFTQRVAASRAQGVEPKMDALHFVRNDPQAFRDELDRNGLIYRPHVRALFKHAIANNTSL